MGVPNLTGGVTNAALVIDRDGFERLAEPLVPVLRLHCYRLVGSLEDAEDMVQETLVRAWRNRDRLRDEAGARPWLFRIATNACLDLLDRKRRRPTATLDDQLGWPDPIPDTWLARRPGGSDPLEAVLRQEMLGLAFLTAVQVLPPRQRAMLVLCDVLEWRAFDVAEALETSVAAVYSGVRRARAAMRVGAHPRSADVPSAVGLADASAVARRYHEAWERADTAGLADLMAADARMAMPPDARVFDGVEAIIGYFDSIFGQPPERRIRLTPTSANGMPAFIVLAPDQATGALRRIGLKVLLVRDGRINEIRGYMRADLAARFEPLEDIRQVPSLWTRARTRDGR
jgi:RNA polymerase sigma-70 factor (ECF subfamily)